MKVSLQHQREQMVGDGYYLSLDVEHWNLSNAVEKPIAVLFDLTKDVEERRAAAAIEEETDPKEHYDDGFLGDD